MTETLNRATTHLAINVPDLVSASEVSASEIAEAPQSSIALLRPTWMFRYHLLLVISDLSCILVAIAFGYFLRFGLSDSGRGSMYVGIATALAVGWALALQASGAYDIRHLATGPEEAKRALRASAITVSVLAVACYATKTEVARGFVIGVIPVGVALVLLCRSILRRIIQRHRTTGAWTHRILAVGTAASVRRLLVSTERAKGAGLKVIGACVDDIPVGNEIAPGVPVVGGTELAAGKAAEIAADVVAVAGHGLEAEAVRELGWQLEETPIGLVVAPALTEVAGPRVHVSPVEGLPLVWLDRPQLGRLPRIAKRMMDVIGGLFLLLVTAPLLIATTMAIKLTSRGPVFFRQRRLGVHGTEFTILKFRSMYHGAEARRARLLEMNEQDGGGVLFKIRRDPRITPVGRWIRQFSIDELPQLVHVLSGKMSLVGPRPLAAIDSHYDGSARRRLLVRPGLTGLWQVSGRSALTWEDSVRFDLYYVENWSIGFDLAILLRTILVVLSRRGAY